MYSTYDRRTANTFYYWRPKRLAGTGREGLYTQPGGPVGLGGISLGTVVQYLFNGVIEPVDDQLQHCSSAFSAIHYFL